MNAKRAIPLFFIIAAAPALAGGGSQLERAAGVEPGSYTLNELSQIVAAEEANDAERLRRYLGGADADVARMRLAPHVEMTDDRGSKGSDR